MRRPPCSFTLVEVVLALALLTMTVLLAAGILQSVQRLWEGMQSGARELETIQSIDRIADHAFRNMIPFQWQDEAKNDRQIFRGNHDTVLFAYLHRSTGQDSGGIRFLQLRLEDGRLAARYRKTPLLFWLDEPDGRHEELEILADGIETLRFEYAEREGDQIVWYEEWPEDRPQIPLAIRMTVVFRNGDRELWLRRTAGNGWETTYGRRLLQ